MEFGRAVAKAMTCAWNQHETRRCYLLATPLEDDVYNLILIALDSVTGLPEVFSCAGLKRPPEYARDWAALARSAMLDSCSEEVRFEMEMSPDGLHELTWSVPIGDGTTRCSATCPLRRGTQHGIGELELLLDTLVGDYGVMRVAVATLERANSVLVEQLSSARHELEEKLKQSRAREQELFVKFTVVLNEKKRKLDELRKEVERQRDTVKQLEDQLEEQGAELPPGYADTDEGDS